MRPAALKALLAVLCVLAASALPAQADLVAPDDSFATAYGPLSFSTTYSGALKNSDDLDYEFFNVPKAGQALRFTVRNNFSCPGKGKDKAPCPLYATLLDKNEKQVGGEGSSAGTGAVQAGTTQYIDWVFAEAGRYVIVLESGSNAINYSLRIDPVASGPPIKSLRVPSSQRGTAVRGRVVFGRAIAQLRTDLLGPGGRLYGRVVRRGLAARGYALKVSLNSRGRAALAKSGKLRLVLRVVAKPETGSTKTLTRRVILSK